MHTSLPDFSTGRVLIVGDVMLDRYWHGSTTRISPEAPVPIVKVEGDEFRAGGAGNVALNAAELGTATALVGLVGRDEAGLLLRKRLAAGGVTCHLLEAPQHPTITKLRIISRHQQLIRLDFEENFAVLESAGIEDAFAAALPGVGALILSDYGKGTLAQVGSLIRVAREQRVPVVVDPKGTDFGRYCGATVITPNMTEFEAVVGHCADEATVVARAEALRDALDLQALLVTRSERGMSLFARGLPPLNLPARARDVFDVTGAGDTVVAVLGAGLACGLTLADATAWANLAAGIVVGKVGTATVTLDELTRAMQAG
ncbi:MAG: D-glycero-beta-D-manno-heptose-7-phosphate kinase [Rhodocyclales bacterium]|nr:D-glycero-beta-D-manno-heptose-7-phosphate kinase [Rhodocyclales bacterium]